jgi:hypothetical protein
MCHSQHTEQMQVKSNQSLDVSHLEIVPLQCHQPVHLDSHSKTNIGISNLQHVLHHPQCDPLHCQRSTYSSNNIYVKKSPNSCMLGGYYILGQALQ